MENEELNLWLKRKGIPEATINLIHSIRTSDPVRKVNSRGNNVTGFFSSEKMGFTLQFESHSLELAAIYEKEYDEKVIEYYEQPNQLKISYPDKNGKDRARRYTPDFFVIEEDWIGWEEWKEEEELKKLAEENPYKYVRDSNNIWRMPPAEKKAKEYGLSFRVRSSSELNKKYIRNIQFLQEYILQPGEVSSIARDFLLETVKQRPTIKLSDLLNGSTQIYSADDIYQLIANREIFVDMHGELIENSEKNLLYPSIESLKTHHNMLQNQNNNLQKININTFDLSEGTLLQWGIEIFLIKVVVGDKILLEKNGKIVDLDLSFVEELIIKGEIKGISKKEKTENEKELSELFLSVDSEIMKEALRRYKFVERVLNGEDYDNIEVPERTLRRWVSSYKKAENKFNFGLVGLYNQKKQRGNRTRKMEPEVIKMTEEYIEKIYENPVQKNAKTVHSQLERYCKESGFDPPSYNTFIKLIKKRDIHTQTLKRKGPRAAYNTEERVHLYLEIGSPRHGRRPFEIVHIDHTQLDIELLSEDGENFGKPYLTLAVDAFSRKVLAFYLTFDPPSYRSNMMVIRELVRIYKRMPASVVVDNGKDFQSIYFDHLLAMYKVTKKKRPPHKSRSGNVIERLFGTNDKQFIHNLIGNTQITKNVRQVTKSNNPKNNAVWTLIPFHKVLGEYLYEIYNNAHHTTLGMSPNNLFLKNISVTGKRKNVYIKDFEDFKILTLPETDKETRIVQIGEGVKINGFYYWCDKFRDPEFHRKEVMIRYEPFDMSKAYAYIDNHWVELFSQHYYDLLIGRTEKEIQVISQEIKKKNTLNGIKKQVTASEIAEFLYRAETTQNIELQRKKDREMRKLLEENKSIQINMPNSMTNNKPNNKSSDTTYDKNLGKEEFLKEIRNNNISGYGKF
jgi:putative transposase